MEMNSFLILFAAYAFTAAGKQIRYDGYKQIGVFGSKEDIAVLNNLVNEEATRNIKMLTVTEFLVSPNELDWFLKQAETYHLDCDIMDENIQSSIDAEARYMKSTARAYSPTNYNGYNEIVNHIYSVADAHDHVALVTLDNKTHEGRDMYVVKIKQAMDFSLEENDVFIECGAHAREWISPAVCVFLIDYLSSPDGVDLREKATFHILPLTNPDGYEFSRNRDRFWRKNRRPRKRCPGVDLNRNFDSFWGTTGVSFNPCSEVYPGSGPFSEPETRNIDAYIKALKEDGKIVTIFLSLHSYGQDILVPFGYSNAAKPNNYNDLLQKGNVVSEAIKAVHGKYYDAYKSSNLYPASGCSDDYAILAQGVEYAYTWELRPGSSSAGGFRLSAKQILPTGEEVAAGLRALIHAVL